MWWGVWCEWRWTLVLFQFFSVSFSLQLYSGRSKERRAKETIHIMQGKRRLCPCPLIACASYHSSTNRSVTDRCQYSRLQLETKSQWLLSDLNIKIYLLLTHKHKRAPIRIWIRILFFVWFFVPSDISLGLLHMDLVHEIPFEDLLGQGHFYFHTIYIYCHFLRWINQGQ